MLRYALVTVIGWPIVAVVVLGLADAIFGFRRRYLQNRPPSFQRREPSTDPKLCHKPSQTNPSLITQTRRINMEVILLERVAKLGHMGEVVRVKDGFARNFPFEARKALRATADNRAKFDGMKAELEARNLKAKGEATKVAEKIDGRNVVVLRQASETVSCSDR